MAQYPCSTGGHRYGGPQRSAYLALVSGAERLQAHLRYCRDHLTAAVATLTALAPSNEDEPDWTECGAPRCPRTATWTAFLTWYDLGEDRADLSARVCDVHARATATTFQLPLGPLQDVA